MPKTPEIKQPQENCTRPSAASLVFAVKYLVNPDECQTEKQILEIAATRYYLLRKVEQIIRKKPCGFARILVCNWPDRALELAPMLEWRLPRKYPNDLEAQQIVRLLILEFDTMAKTQKQKTYDTRCQLANVVYLDTRRNKGK